MPYCGMENAEFGMKIPKSEILACGRQAQSEM
jgi:hypothetical protein